jgi:hypothetical protein
MLLPHPDQGVVAAEAPGGGPGYWSGAPCAVAGDGEVFLAYRLRRPLGQGRGYAVAVARSADGERFETLEAAHPGEFDIRYRETVLPGDTKTGVKDPVIVFHRGQWHLWASCHLLDDPLQTDQMTTEYATSWPY